VDSQQAQITRSSGSPLLYCFLLFTLASTEMVATIPSPCIIASNCINALMTVRNLLFGKTCFGVSSPSPLSFSRSFSCSSWVDPNVPVLTPPCSVKSVISKVQKQDSSASQHYHSRKNPKNCLQIPKTDKAVLKKNEFSGKSASSTTTDSRTAIEPQTTTHVPLKSGVRTVA